MKDDATSNVVLCLFCAAASGFFFDIGWTFAALPFLFAAGGFFRETIR